MELSRHIARWMQAISYSEFKVRVKLGGLGFNEPSP